MNRNLDGVYFRVERGGKWQPICFTDMTEEEIESTIGDRPAEWWKGMAMALRETIQDIGEQFDIICGEEE